MKRKLLMIGFVGVSFVACGNTSFESLTSAEPTPANAAPAAPPPVAAAPTSTREGFKALQPFFFAFKRAPIETEGNIFRSNLAAFTPTVEVEAEVDVAQQAPATPLQVYDTDSYKLVLIMSGTATPKAQVIDPQGKAYIIRVGDPIGNRNGKVVSISGTEVRIEEPGYPPVVKSLQVSDEEMLRELRAVQEF